MSLPLTDTAAGNDSDGKIWGIEGVNLLIILSGLLLTLGFLVLSWLKMDRISSGICLVSLIPLIAAVNYVFFFRQGKPKGYDTDLIETLIAGRGWMPAFPRRRVFRFDWMKHNKA